MGAVLMDKVTHSILQEYNKMVAELYFELNDLGIAPEKLDHLLEKFDVFYDKAYSINDHEDQEKVMNQEAILTSNYEEWPKYLKLTVIYDYDNGFSLCKNSVGNVCLIPTDLISHEFETNTSNI